MYLLMFWIIKTKQNKPKEKAGEERQSEDMETFWNLPSISEQGLLGSWESLLVSPRLSRASQGPIISCGGCHSGVQGNIKNKTQC